MSAFPIAMCETMQMCANLKKTSGNLPLSLAEELVIAFETLRIQKNSQQVLEENSWICKKFFPSLTFRFRS